MNGSKTRPRLRLVSWLLLPALLAACSSQSGSKGPTFGAGITGTATNGLFSLTVNINPNTVGRGGSAGITVVAQTPNGIPLKGKSVQMSTSGGILSSVAGTTDAAGKFVTSISIPEDFDSSVASVDVSATVDGLTAKATLNIGSLGVLAIVPTSATLAPGATQFFNCTGGVPPYKWEASGGTINISSGPSVIYTAGNQFGTFTLKCTDAAGTAVGAQITITNQALQAPVIAPTSAQLRPNQTQTFTVTGGTPPYSWSATGGTLNTTAGTSVVYTAGNLGQGLVCVTDGAGKQACATITITITPPKILPATVTRTFGATPSGSSDKVGSCNNIAITVTFTVTDGAPPYTMSATSGSFDKTTLPGPGTVTYSVTLNNVTGGTTDTETVTVLDSGGQSATATITITCTPPPSGSGPVPAKRRPIGVSGS